MEPEYKEQVSCTYCGTQFERRLDERWKKACLQCYIESKRPARDPFVSEGVLVVGLRYKPSGCACGLPPWELCKPMCEHAI